MRINSEPFTNELMGGFDETILEIYPYITLS